MAPAAGQAKSGYWNSGDDVKLRSLFDSRRVGTKLRSKKETKPIRKEHFPHTKYNNFRVNFLKKVAQWEVNEEKKGSNGSNDRKRGKYLFCLCVPVQTQQSLTPPPCLPL